MLAAAFFVTVVVALGGYHLLVERPRRAMLQQVQRQAHARPAPLEEVVGAVPGGVFLQNGFTWSRIVQDGSVEIGVHPMLQGLVGDDIRYSLEDPGQHIDRGEPFLGIGTGDRSVHVRAPLSGRITAQNRFPPSRVTALDVKGDAAAWLYRIQPDDLAGEIPAWMIGAHAKEWTRDRYERIREHLQHAVAGGEIGLALADGGEVPIGALSELDPQAWSEFEARFLAD